MTRSKFAIWVDQAFWYLLVGIIGLGVKSLQDLASSVSDLNIKIAVVIDQVGHQGDELREHASRIHDIESKLVDGRHQ